MLISVLRMRSSWESLNTSTKYAEKEKEMLDQIRIRNGNLTVASQSAGLSGSEL